jgi:hypothetical protein
METEVVAMTYLPAALPAVLPGEDRSYGAGLFVDLIPRTSWFRNVRAAVDPADSDRLRRMVYRRAGLRCEACGARRVQLEAHERFIYDTRAAIQRLVRLICLCTACHQVTHFGHTRLLGDAAAQAAINHLQTVTGMTAAETERHIRDAFALWERRSRTPWRVDLSMISDAGIGLRTAGIGHRSPAAAAGAAVRPSEASRARLPVGALADDRGAVDTPGADPEDQAASGIVAMVFQSQRRSGPCWMIRLSARIWMSRPGRLSPSASINGAAGWCAVL